MAYFIRRLKSAGAGAACSVLITVVSNQRRGAELEAVEVGAALTELGVDVNVVALKPTSSEQHIDIPTLGRRALSWRTLVALRRMSRRADLVIAYGSKTLPACVLALFLSRKRFVYRSIGDPSHWLRSEFHRVRTGILYRRAAAVVVLWPGAAHIVNSLFGVKRERTFVVPNCRSAKTFSPTSSHQRRKARDTFGLTEGDFVVAVVGSLTEEKRVDRAIDAVAMCGAFLLVVGAGEQREDLERLATSRMSGRFRFTGQLSDVSIAYQAADVLLLASRTEGMPGVILEAAMSGLGFVAPDVGAVEWLADLTGLGHLFAADDDAEAIAAALVASRDSPRRSRPDTLALLETASVARMWLQVLRKVLDAEVV